MVDINVENAVGISTPVSPSNPLPALPWRVARVAITFDGTSDTGGIGAVPIFTVTGEVIVMRLIPYCTTLLAEGGATVTMSLGVTGSVALFVAATEPEDIDANEFWFGTTPAANGEAIPAALKDVAITDDIIGTIANDTVDTGVLEFTCYWLPISTDGDVS